PPGFVRAVGRRAADAAHQPQRADRPPPPLHLDGPAAGGRQGRAPPPRRHAQRRRAGADHPRVPRPAGVPGRGRGGPRAAVARPGVGAAPRRPRHGRRRRHPGEPGVGDVRRAPRGGRRPGRAAGRHRCPAGRPQAVEAGGGRRGPHLARGVRPAMLLSLGMRVATRAARRMGQLDTVTTNVPGPQFPLWSCGRRLLRALPYVPLAAPLRVGVAVFSYDGELAFGVTADADTADDVDVLAQGIRAELDDLLAHAPAATPPAAGAPASGVSPAAAVPTIGAVSTPKLYHNPRCSKSRAAKDLLGEWGVEVEVVEYLKTPPSRAELEAIVAGLEGDPQELVRTKDPKFKALGVD